MSRELFERFARAAGKDYSRDAVIEAAAALILNAVRQKHIKLAGAQDEVAQLEKDMQAALRRDHYGRDGVRRNHIILGDNVLQMLRHEGIVR